MEAIQTGLDYAAVAALLEIYGVKDGRECLEKIRVMELEALSVLSAERERLHPRRE